MAKPFFFKIIAADLLNFATDPEGEGMTLLKFSKELQKGESEFIFIQGIIDEAKNFSESKRLAGKLGGLAKASSAKADPSSAKAEVSTPLAISSSISINSKEEPKTIVVKHDVEEVITFLNSTTGSKYRASTKATASIIIARINEGFSVEDIKTVITKKSKEWKGTDMAQYLRPSTLFAPSKFEGYLNQPDQNNNSKQLNEGGLIDCPCPL